MKTKRLATEDEVEEALKQHAAWCSHEGTTDMTLDDLREKLEVARGEGYKDEVCECGVVFLAFHHFVRCEDKDCPFKDGGPSVLEQIMPREGEHLQELWREDVSTDG